MWKKRLVSMAMALVLAVSLLPTTAWAWSYSVGTLDDLKRQLGYGGERTIEVTGTIESPIKGAEGNVEYLVRAVFQG